MTTPTPQVHRRTIEFDPTAQRKLGRHVEHDDRSRAYAFSEDVAPKVDTIDHHRVSDMLDQNVDITFAGRLWHGLGSCTGNALVGAMGTDPLMANAPAVGVLNEMLAVAVYSEATQRDGFGEPFPANDRGSSGLAVAKVALGHGWCAAYQHAFSLAAMQKALMVAPVFVGVNWYDSFDDPDPSTGNVSLPGEAQIRGGHEFEVVGQSLNLKVFRAVNSWGTDWGQDGYFYIPFDVMERLLAEDGDVTLLIPPAAPAPTPEPTPTPTPEPTPTPAPTPTPDEADQALLRAMEQWKTAKGY